MEFPEKVDVGEGTVGDVGLDCASPGGADSKGFWLGGMKWKAGGGVWPGWRGSERIRKSNG